MAPDTLRDIKSSRYVPFEAEHLKAPAKQTQHIATLLGATCCVSLDSLLRHFATCWVLLAQI